MSESNMNSSSSSTPSNSSTSSNTSSTSEHRLNINRIQELAELSADYLTHNISSNTNASQILGYFGDVMSQVNNNSSTGNNEFDHFVRKLNSEQKKIKIPNEFSDYDYYRGCYHFAHNEGNCEQKNDDGDNMINTSEEEQPRSRREQRRSSIIREQITNDPDLVELEATYNLDNDSLPTRNLPTRNLPTRNLPTRNLPNRNPQFPTITATSNHSTGRNGRIIFPQDFFGAFGLSNSDDFYHTMFPQFSSFPFNFIQQQTDVRTPLRRENFNSLQEKAYSEIKNDKKTVTHQDNNTTTTESKHNDACPICLNQFQDQDKVKILPCNHIGHVECLTPWLTQYNHTCPVCKASCGPSNPVV